MLWRMLTAMLTLDNVDPSGVAAGKPVVPSGDNTDDTSWSVMLHGLQAAVAHIVAGDGDDGLSQAV